MLMFYIMIYLCWLCLEIIFRILFMCCYFAFSYLLFWNIREDDNLVFYIWLMN